MGNLGPLELTLILVIVVLLFGAKRLPETAKSVGQSLKIFKKTIADDDKDKEAPREVTSQNDAAPPPPAQTRSDEPNRTEL
jgi:sec-independent protein translocase protein TatA